MSVSQHTNYEYACNLVTLLQILRQHPRPARMSSNLSDTLASATSSGNATDQWFQFANCRLRRPKGMELLPFPGIQKRPHALVLKMVVDGDSTRDRGGSCGPSANIGSNIPPAGGNYYKGRASSGLSNGSFCSQSLDTSTAGGAVTSSSFAASVGYGGLTSIAAAGGYQQPSAADVHASFTTNSLGSPSSNFYDEGMRTLETWTIEAFSEATLKATHAVISKGQLAGLCRHLCSHAVMNQLPKNTFRVASLETSAVNSFTQQERAAIFGGARGSRSPAASPSPQQQGPTDCPEGWSEQRWRITTADGIPCFIITWRLHDAAIQHLTTSQISATLTRRLSRMVMSPQQMPVAGPSSGRLVASSFNLNETAAGNGSMPPHVVVGSFEQNGSMASQRSARSQTPPAAPVGNGVTDTNVGQHAGSYELQRMTGGVSFGTNSNLGGMASPVPSTSMNPTPRGVSPKHQYTSGSSMLHPPTSLQSTLRGQPSNPMTSSHPGLHGVANNFNGRHLASKQTLDALIEGCERLTSNTQPHGNQEGHYYGADFYYDDPYSERDAVHEYRLTMAKVRQLTRKVRGGSRRSRHVTKERAQ